MSKQFFIKASNNEVIEWVTCYQLTYEEQLQIKIILHFKPFIESIARKFSFGKSYYEDMIQVGMIGLLGAIQRFNAEYGNSFEAFAIPTIVGEMKRYLRDKTWDIHVPRNVRELGPRIQKAIEQLMIQLHRMPTIHEIASLLEIEDQLVLEAIEIGRGYKALSIDSFMPNELGESRLTLLDIVGKEDEAYEHINLRLVIACMLHMLEERERRVIELTYLQQLNQRVVGEMLGISQMHVSRLKRKAIHKIQNSLKVSEFLR